MNIARLFLRVACVLGLCVLFAGPGPFTLNAPSHHALYSDKPPAVAFCFAPGTPEDVIERHYRTAGPGEYRHSLESPIQGFQFDDTARWTRTATDGLGLGQGDPTVITWSIVPDGTTIEPSYVGESSNPSDVKSFLNGIYGNQTTWFPVLEGVFERWGELCGVTYVYEPNDDGAALRRSNMPAGQLGVRGDVRIAGHRIDGNQGVLAYNYFPNGGEMILDTSDNVLKDKSNNSLKLRNTMAHEHGHGLGVSHVCPMSQTKLMEPMLALAFDGPQHDDILAANRGYGDRLEPSDSRFSAGSLGTLSAGSDIVETNLSIDDNADGDYLSFVINAPMEVSATLTPVGSTYLSGPQNQLTGQCTPGTSFNSLTIHNLALEIQDQFGAILASADNAPAGGTEELLNVSLTVSPATYYVHVSGKTTNAAQLYDLTLSGSGSSANPVVYEATSAQNVMASPYGPAPSSPHIHTPLNADELYYKLDDGAGYPGTIRLVKSGTDLAIHF